jgi:FkbM family methyltransferase
MKLRELLYLLGMPKPPPRTYGYEVVEFDLAREGRIQVASWLHPHFRLLPLLQEDVDAVRAFLRPGDVVIDVGAHVGDLSYALAVGCTGAVIAFEPNRFVFPILEANTALNRSKGRILPYRYAIAPQDGKMTFEYGDSGYCNGGRHEGIGRWVHGSAFELEVEAVRLEPFLRANHPDLIERIRFVKIDAEGYDVFVLESIQDLVRRVRPYLRIEVNKHTRRESRVRLLRILADLGYGVERMPSESEYHGEAIDEGNVMAWRHYDVFCTPRRAAGSDS